VLPTRSKNFDQQIRGPIQYRRLLGEIRRTGDEPEYFDDPLDAIQRAKVRPETDQKVQHNKLGRLISFFHCQPLAKPALNHGAAIRQRTRSACEQEIAHLDDRHIPSHWLGWRRERNAQLAQSLLGGLSQILASN
jgi:hypothetical protein